LGAAHHCCLPPFYVVWHFVACTAGAVRLGRLATTPAVVVLAQTVWRLRSVAVYRCANVAPLVLVRAMDIMRRHSAAHVLTLVVAFVRSFTGRCCWLVNDSAVLYLRHAFCGGRLLVARWNMVNTALRRLRLLPCGRMDAFLALRARCAAFAASAARGSGVVVKHRQTGQHGSPMNCHGWRGTMYACSVAIWRRRWTGSSVWQ